MAEDDIDVFLDEDPSIKESEDARKQRRTRELGDIRRILDLPEGRRFIWRLWGMTGCFKASFIPKDTNMTMFREGQRDIGMALLEDVNFASPYAYAKMKEEYIRELLKKKENSNAK